MRILAHRAFCRCEPGLMPDSMDVERKEGEAPEDAGGAADPDEQDQNQLSLKIKTLDNKHFTVHVEKDVRCLVHPRMPGSPAVFGIVTSSSASACSMPCPVAALFRRTSI